jgi:exodeoxyribonuclease X
MATPAHRAGPDAYVTAFLLEAMLQLATPQQLIDWTNQPALLVRIPFGNLKGRPWTEADDGFLDWVLERDFDDDVMFTAAHHQALRRTERAAATALCSEEAAA